MKEIRTVFQIQPGADIVPGTELGAYTSIISFYS